MNKQVIIVFGPPGAGKGSQSELLSDKFGLYLFETSKILEEKFREAENLDPNSKERFVEVGGEKYDILNEKEIWKKGDLCSPPLVTYLVKQKIEVLFKEGKSLVLSGSPRTLYEAEKLTPFLKELYGLENIKAIFLKIKPESTIFRNSHRRICELMRHPIIYNEETAKLTICPLDGSKLIKRKGLDDPETIKNRLEQYRERTLPVIEFLKKQGIKVKEIDGEPSVAEVFEDVVKAIK